MRNNGSHKPQNKLLFGHHTYVCMHVCMYALLTSPASCELYRITRRDEICT